MRTLAIVLGVLWVFHAELRAEAPAPAKAAAEASADAPVKPAPAPAEGAAKPAASAPATPVPLKPIPVKAGPNSGWIPLNRGPVKPQDLDYNFTVGVDLYWPYAHFEWAVAKRVSLGVMPAVFRYTFEGIRSLHYGGYLTVSSYTKRNFEGTWVRFGLGAFHTKSERVSGGLSGTQPTLSALVTLGQRWRWEAFNLALSAGVGYYESFVVKSFPLRLGVLYPSVTFDFGFAW